MDTLDVEVLVLRKAEIEELITFEDVIKAVETVFRAQTTESGLSQPRNTHIFADPPKNRKLLLSMPCYIKALDVAGIKWTNAYYGDPKPGIPPIWGGLVILNDPETGIPYAIMDDTAITSLRTAGGHAVVAAKYLARRDSRKMAIIGCGVEGRTGLLAFSKIFPLEEVKIYDTMPEAMHACREEAASKVKADIIPVESAEKAFDGVDIILLATSAVKPILMEPMVPAGCFVAGLRRFVDMDPSLSRKADKWVLGNRITDGDFNTPDIGLSYDHVYADMGEIVTGARPGRENDRERIVYTHMGMGAHDIAIGCIAYKKAMELRLGTRVRTI
jgi:ornithine cyclodeaminase/alanine dehydrogenase-like protein (mu-crystallin family)